MEDTTKQLETKRILIFLGLTFCMTILYCVLVIYPIANGSNLSQLPAAFIQLSVALAMFFPAIGVLLTRLITKEGFRDAWIRPNIKGNIKTYLLAYFGPGLLTFIGCLIYFLLLWCYD